MQKYFPKGINGLEEANRFQEIDSISTDALKVVVVQSSPRKLMFL